MNADLENTLDELGPAYRDVVARLKVARDVEPRTKHQGRGLESTSPALPGAGTLLWRVGYLAAASVVVALGLSVFMRGAANAPRAQFPSPTAYTAAYVSTDEALEAIVTTQRADGSWKNDFLTQQNAAALRASPDARMRVAYRRAVRYLRSKGLAPLTDAELKARGDRAAKMLADV